MPFFETEFPTAVAYSAQGGPGFSTSVNVGFSGYEQRNRNWALALGKWKVDLYQKPQTYFEAVYAFWLCVGGRADAFRFKDHKDFNATAQAALDLGTAYHEFQLQKTYTIGGRTYVRTIKKPITSAVDKFDGSACADTVHVYVGGSELGVGDFSVDEETGIVMIPGYTTGAVTADFEFHFPVRFDIDECQAVIEESDVAGGDAHITWPAVQLVEVRF